MTLHRSQSDRWIAGVAAGVAETLSIDPIIVRVVWILGTLAAPPAGIIAYLVLWVALPDQPQPGSSHAVRIAEERYARGEIDAEELQRIKRDLGAA